MPTERDKLAKCFHLSYNYTHEALAFLVVPIFVTLDSKALADDIEHNILHCLRSMKNYYHFRTICFRAFGA